MRVAPIIDQTCTPQFPRASSLDTASHDLITWPGKGRNVCEAMSSVITGNGRRVEGSARLVCALRKSDGMSMMDRYFVTVRRSLFIDRRRFCLCRLLHRALVPFFISTAHYTA